MHRNTTPLVWAGAAYRQQRGLLARPPLVLRGGGAGVAVVLRALLRNGLPDAFAVQPVVRERGSDALASEWFTYACVSRTRATKIGFTTGIIIIR
jgi:hypothetical protein